MQRSDILLMAVATAGDSGLSPVQLQKTLFLVGQSGLDAVPSDFYAFEPYNYGPFSKLVYEDADSLAQQGLVGRASVPGQTWAKYVITGKGEQRSREVEAETKAPLREYIGRVVAWVQDLSFNELLRSVYKAYPDYRRNSVFQESL